MASTPMRQLAKLPFGILVFWASPWSEAARFSYPGIHVWVPGLRNHLRVLPLPRCYDLHLFVFRYGRFSCWACGGVLHYGWPRLLHLLIRWHRAASGPVYRVLTEEEQEAVREAARNDPEFMAGVREGMKARAEGRVTPWSEVKKELGIK